MRQANGSIGRMPLADIIRPAMGDSIRHLPKQHRIESALKSGYSTHNHAVHRLSNYSFREKHNRPVRTVLYGSNQSLTRTNYAGLPAIVVNTGTSLVTTLPDPTTAPSPIVRPGNTMTFAPNHTSFPFNTALLEYPASKMLPWFGGT